MNGVATFGYKDAGRGHLQCTSRDRRPAWGNVTNAMVTLGLRWRYILISMR